jgi:small subunit ribosomal protein S20
MAEEKKQDDSKKKERKPTALKRDAQAEKKRLHNKQFRSSVKTALRTLETAIKNKADTSENLNAVFSLMDKGVKTGVFKQNKADRVKSKYAKATA